MDRRKNSFTCSRYGDDWYCNTPEIRKLSTMFKKRSMDIHVGWRLIASVGVAVLLSGCKTTHSLKDNMITGSILGSSKKSASTAPVAKSSLSPLAQATQYWNKAWTKNPKDSKRDIVKAFELYRGRVLFVYGGADPEAAGAQQMYEPFCQEHGIDVEFHVVEGANHSFYSTEWKQRVIDLSVGWLASE